MSSLRNAIQRRNHRERAQPAERAKWGILEKHKDYKLRAADHNVKKRKIKALKGKASTRNEDEFYFAMMNSSSQGGVKRARRGEENSGGGGKSLSLDVVKLLKTQDQGYLQTMLQRTRRERERLEQSLAIHETGVSMMPSNRRVVFNENGEIEDLLPEPRTYDDEEPEEWDGLDDLQELGNTPSFLEDEEMESAQDDSEDEDLTPKERSAKRSRKRALDSERRKLAAMKDQEQKLGQALSGLDHQRAKMNGTIGGTNRKGVTFKLRHRKR